MALILDPGATPPPAGDAPSDAIFDTDTQRFVADVIEASMKTPVIVDFWAPWCGPCKQLTPMLEKLVRQAGGAVRLAKVNVDENQALAGQLRVQSVPTVYAFVGGQPVDAFVGAQNESQLRAFVDRLMGGAETPIDHILADARAALDAGDGATAQAIYSEILAQDSTNPEALAGLIRALVVTGDAAGARQIVESLTPELRRNAEVSAAVAAVELAETGGGADDTQGLRARVAANADDHEARFDLAVALYGAGDAEGAIEALLELVRRDRAWNEDAARKQLVKIFDALGGTHPLTVASRRRLSSILFS